MESFFAALVNQVFWLFLIYSFLAPILKQRMLEAARLQAITDLEKKRGSRVIAMIHRQEALALFGIPLFRYINIEDAEELLRAVRMTPPDKSPAGRDTHRQNARRPREEARRSAERGHLDT